MKNHSFNHAGFSLIEVALALGVSSFALVAIFGLLPIGLNSNQASLEQTAAATHASSLVADLQATAQEIPPVAQNSPRFQIPIPISGTATHTIFLREDGSASGTVNTNASPALDPRYRVTLFITAPTAATQKTATTVRVFITWPALADQTAGALPTKFSGSYEVVTALSRH